MYLRICPKLTFIINHKKYKGKICCEINGKIFNILKNTPKESLIPMPMIILIILFCSFKILLQYEEFPQKVIP